MCLVTAWVNDLILYKSSICHSINQDYPKLSQNYYGLLECLSQDHMSFISNLEPHVLLYILSSISEGFTALGNTIVVFIVFNLAL